ncbi:hypothetical protein T492DRAFT_1055755 [Pavlovales sp. CCMP2436]|nr:hypothetical protein T492DRAFT_1055755 [Pavlovales sp. CCMP2436]
MSELLRRHAFSVALLAVWWACEPTATTWSSRDSLADVVTLSFVKTEAFARLGRSEALVVAARALACALLVVKLSLFERGGWHRPWLPMAMQAVNLVVIWLETLAPLVWELWSMASVPDEVRAAEAEAEATADAARWRQRQVRARTAAAKTEAAERAAAAIPPAPRVEPLLVLARRALADALAAGCLEIDADDAMRCDAIPIPTHLLSPLFEDMRLRGLLDDRTLPFVVAPESATVRLSAAAAGDGGAAARYALPRKTCHPCLLSDMGVGLLAARCPQLLELHLTDCDALSDNGVLLLAAGCPLLHVLELRRCPLLTSAALLEMAERLPGLEVLLLGGCGEVDDTGVCAIGTRCLALRSLDVGGCSIRDESLHVLGEFAHSLSDLSIAGCFHVSSCAIRALATTRASLRTLAISRSPSCSSWFTDGLLRNLPQLELVILAAQVPPSLRWHPLPFTEFG